MPKISLYSCRDIVLLETRRAAGTLPPFSQDSGGLAVQPMSLAGPVVALFPSSRARGFRQSAFHPPVSQVHDDVLQLSFCCSRQPCLRESLHSTGSLDTELTVVFTGCSLRRVYGASRRAAPLLRRLGKDVSGICHAGLGEVAR